MWNSRLNALCFISLFTATLVGCGTKDPLQRQGATGIVTLDGTPVANGTITFEPLSPGGHSSGATVTEGAYKIPPERGLPPGEYLIRISAASHERSDTNEAGGDVPPPAKELIPTRYNARSDLKCTVEVGKPNKFDFELTTKAK